MKTILIALTLVIMASARPQAGKDATILKYENDVSPEGYKFAYETSDGISRDEEGKPGPAGEDGPAVVVNGSFSWKDEKTGQVYTVTFTADENGYKPQVKIA